MKWIFASALTVTLITGPRIEAATAAETGNAGVTIDAHAEVAAVLYAASATQAAFAKTMDVRLRAQQDRIKALAAELKAGDTRHRAEMISAQESFVAELAAKNREYAVQIELFRNTVTDIASTPEGAAALEHFNAGDEVGAIAILDRLRATNESMRAARAKLEDAAEGRRIALLALEARKRGKLTTQAVIARFEEVVKLDPGVVTDWLELDRLYQDLGQLDDAKKAVDAMAAHATTNLDRGKALAERSDVLLLQGDLAGSRSAAEQAVAINRQLAAADPNNISLHFTLSRALTAFGLAARRQDDLSTAQKAYEEDMTLTRRLIAINPSNVDLRGVLSADLLHLADVLTRRHEYTGARRAIEESLGISRRLAAETSDDMVYARHIDVTLMWLSDVLVAAGAFADAHKANVELLATATRLTAADPANAILQRDLVYAYYKIAVLQRIEGNFNGAIDSYGRSLIISRELARPTAASRDLKEDVATQLSNIAELKYLKHDLQGARQASEEAVAELRTLVAADATDASVRQFLADALFEVGEASCAMQDYESAHKAYDEGLALDRVLAAKNPDDGDVQDSTSDGQLGMGRLQKMQGDDAAAQISMQQSLDTRRALAVSHPGDSNNAHGVAEVMRALVDMPGSKVGWAEFRAQIESMNRDGILWPADHAWLEEARQHAFPRKTR